MDVDFQAKVEKYEGKAAKYREAALKAAEGAPRNMCEGRATMAILLPISGRPGKSSRRRSIVPVVGGWRPLSEVRATSPQDPFADFGKLWALHQ
jgi:hypothetical protein